MSDLAEHAEMRLPFWSEIVGTFQGLFTDDGFVYVRINNKLLSFSKESMESEILRNKLDNALVGQKIGVLRCDEGPLQIRIVKRGSAKVKTGLKPRR